MRLVDLLVEITNAKKITDSRYETLQKNLGTAFSQKKGCRDFFNGHSSSHSYFSATTMPVTNDNYFVFKVTYSAGEKMLQIDYYGNNYRKYETDVFPLKEFDDFMDAEDEKSTTELIKGIIDESDKIRQATIDRNKYVNEFGEKFKNKRGWGEFFGSRCEGAALDGDFYERILSSINFSFISDDKMRIELTDYYDRKPYCTKYFPVEEFIRFIDDE